ncbi:MAG: SEC-C domain-containing protein [Myxococcales bacterium]|nr:SEC-C domain-containing protein [Myxococcales bacterium]
MPLPSRNAPCPCHSGRKAKACCEPILAGAPAPTPEALMRSRYSAYACSHLAHLVRTTAPNSPHRREDSERWREELLLFCETTSFDGLEIRAATQDGDRGEVTFFATLRREGKDASFGERSRFVRHDGRWTYVDGDPVER